MLVSERLLAEAQPGLLDNHIAPLRNRIEEILANEHLSQGNIGRRVRILPMAARGSTSEHFTAAADALMRRRRLAIVYHGRERDKETERTVSPQRLAHYRDNWYLDAWCHLKNDLRSFSLDRVRHATVLPQKAKEVPEPVLDQHFAAAYGIFAGQPKQTAVLRFTPERARWVAEERWHRQQEGRFLDNGGYELHIPYNDPRELIMDILKYGPDVEVVAPDALREQIATRLKAALHRYGKYVD